MTEEPFAAEARAAAAKALGRALNDEETKLLDAALAMHRAAAQLRYPIARAILAIFE
jgi:hypothetical protein